MSTSSGRCHFSTAVSFRQHHAAMPIDAASGTQSGSTFCPKSPTTTVTWRPFFHVQLDRTVFTRRIWFRRGSGAGSLLVAVVVVLAGEPVLGGLVGDVAEAVAGG